MEEPALKTVPQKLMKPDALTERKAVLTDVTEHAPAVKPLLTALPI